MNRLFRDALSNIKNVYGWKTKRRIVVLAVDDYGNVRVNGPAARAAITAAGFPPLNMFDEYDTLATESDLCALYEVLDSVRDQNNRPAVFTALTLPANIDFERMRAEDYRTYHYELLPVTLGKLPGYENVWARWQEGIRAGWLFPQFHGREHLNLRVFEHHLRQRDPATMTALAHRSYTNIKNTAFPNVGYTAAFDFEESSELDHLAAIATDGLARFEEVFGFRSRSFNSPGTAEHSALHATLANAGVEYIETHLIKREHQGGGNYRREVNYTGKRTRYDQVYLVRNCVFEPTHERGVDWIPYTLRQVEAAFRWNRPAIISSHRVNFCGSIDPQQRRNGLTALRGLLEQIKQRYPDIEFMTTVELGDLIRQTKS